MKSRHVRPRRAFRLFRPVIGAACVLAFCHAVPLLADVRWQGGGVSVSDRMPQASLRTALAELSGRTGARHVLVHLDGPPGKTRRDRLSSGGVHLLSYLGEHAWFARLDEDIDAQRIAADGFLRRIDPIPVAAKLHADLAAGVVRPWTVVEPRPVEGPVDPKAPAPTPEVVALTVLFHADFDAETAAAGRLAGHGARVASTIRSLNGVVVHVPVERIEALAADDVVMWVEPPLPKLTVVNDSNRPRVGADVLQAPPYSLDGSGVTVLVYDGGQMFAHGDFAGRLTVGASDTSGISDHATHVGGTIGGDGAGSAGQYRGMAPGVDLVSFGFEQEGGLTEGFLYTDPGDIEADYGEAIATYGADISNNSIGSNTAPNGFPCDWEGNYGATGALIDEIARGSLGAPFRIVWAAGNERQGSGRCGTTYNTTAPPAGAKNHITIGALNSNDDSVTDFTSWGPTDDGRLKPDVSGPGCESGGDGGVTSTGSSGGYNVKCGTSMASPTIAGVAALMLQQYRLSFPGEPDFRNSTLKATLATTAEDVAEPGPDFKTGYGSVRAVPAVELVAAGNFLEAEISQGEIYSFLVIVGPDDTEMKVTLAWDDPAGTPNVNPVLVNDLDLRVFDPSGTQRFPWTLDPANPATPAARTQRDGLNNIEQVVVDTPAPGAYRVEIEGFNVAVGPSQWFSAAALPTVVNCAPAGNLGTDAGRISCEADLGLQVIDCDLNTDDALTETVNVSLTSGSEPAGEVATLTESAPESAAFLGSMPVSTTDAPGTLQVAEGDTISVTYVDADDGEGGISVPVVRLVAVDCTAPVVTSVATSEINPRDALVNVGTDEDSRVTVRFGTACGVVDDSLVSFSLKTSHDLRLQGLADDTSYWFTVEAADEAGNTTIDDNQGACYTFTTPEVPNFFSEQFSAGSDLVGFSTTFTPNASVDYYGFCTEPLGGTLPTDPAAGNVLSLSDDQPGSFDLTGGASVSLYGVSYTTVHVGPNGYLTFGSGDSTYNESFAAHFGQPRIAAVFDDLNPSVGGTVSWKQLADRVAVTWENVPEYSTSNSNTFQIEVFLDGGIRLSWLQLDSQDSIAGLSSGAGLDPEFFATDLSDGSGCGPRPPAALDLTMSTAVDTALPVTLLASDDGLPEPAALVYRITRLPGYGSLVDDVTTTAVTSVPWTLGGDAVTYTPGVGAQGWDSFDYHADDGGVAPEGGQSTPALVGVTIGGRTTVHEFLVDDTDPGWSTTGDWAFGVPTGGGSNGGDPTGGFTGANVFGYNLAGDYPDNMGVEYLTSLPVNLAGVQGAELEFRRWLGVESSTYDHASVQVSLDGTGWTDLWDHAGGSFSDSEWTLQTFDLSPANGQPAVSFRWSMGTTDGSVTYPGWNIDDVRVTGLPPVSCTGAPAAAPNLGFGFDRDTLGWDRASYSSGDQPVYDVLRSGASTDFGLAALCVESDDADTLALDAATPGPGEAWFYLVRPENTCGIGPLGSDSAGTPRSGRACP